MKGFFISTLSLLPLGAAYKLSNILYIVLYYVVGYRKKLVRKNLSNAFPDKETIALKRIEQLFYRHFVDIIIESFQIKAWKKGSFNNQIQFSEAAKAILNHYERSEQSIIMVLGHYGNWEWAGACMGANTNFDQVIIYKPIKDKAIEQIINTNRSKFDTEVVPMNNAFRHLLQKKTTFSVSMNADQSPRGHDVYWTTFLNQETAFFNGPEKFAKKLGLPMLYTSIKKERRGSYLIELQELYNGKDELIENQLTEAFVRSLECDIKAVPEYWLWSHNRWKRNRKKPMQEGSTET